MKTIESLGVGKIAEVASKSHHKYAICISLGGHGVRSQMADMLGIWMIW